MYWTANGDEFYVGLHHFFLDKGRAIYLMSQPKENRLVLLCAARSSL